MRKLGILATAGIMSLTAVSATFGTAGEAEAKHRRSGEVIAGAAIGLLGGVLLGQALAPPAYGAPVYGAPSYYPPAYYPTPRYYQPNRYYAPPRVIYRQPVPVYREPVPVYRHRHVGARDAHVAWCAQRYRSYRPYDNTWVAYSGHVRQCVSPYSY